MGKRCRKWILIMTASMLTMNSALIPVLASKDGGEEAVTQPSASVEQSSSSAGAEFSAGSSSDVMMSEPSQGSLVDSDVSEETMSSESDREGKMDYIGDGPMSEEQIEEERMAISQLSEMPMEDETVDAVTGTWGEESYPSQYDLRSYTTSVRNQENSSMCWSYATVAAAEVSLVMNGVFSSNRLNLSERHLAFCAYNTALADPLGNITGDYNYLLRATDYFSVGGNPLIAAMVLSQWKGLTGEYAVLTDDGSLEKEAILTDFAQVHKTDMKRALVEYGPLAITCFMSADYLNPSTGAYCYNGEAAGVNHATAIVGWDDNYSKENFAETSNVTRNGAWIVKNSWGEDRGDHGYYYVSYEDSTISSIVAARYASAEQYDHNYQYDGTAITLDGIATQELAVGDSVANVYRVKGNQDGAEELRAIGFQLRNANTQFTVKIYKNLLDKKNPSSGILAYASEAERTTFQGYYTIELTEPVTLEEGSYYSIVITAENNFKYYVERSYESSDENAWIGYHARLDPGQSFSKRQGAKTWRDNYDEEFCARIKGFTVDVD